MSVVMAAAGEELAEKMKKPLFDWVMKRDWEEVVKIYKGYPEVHSAKITRSGETALHIAVSYGEERIVEQLVELILQGGELEMVLKFISTEANTVLKKTIPPRLKSLVKESVKSISDTAKQALGKISQPGGNTKEAVQIISDLEAISRGEFSDQLEDEESVQIISDLEAISGGEFSHQLEDEAKKALEIISSKARQAKEIIYRAEAKKALEAITGEAKKALEKLYEEDDELRKKNALLKNIIPDDTAKSNVSKEALEEETKRALIQSISDKAFKAKEALSEITDHEVKSEAKQEISDLANKESLEAIPRDKWKETLEKIVVDLEKIYAGEAKKSLEIKNKRGNTALHVAAERGSVGMCHCIAQIYWEGLGVQNSDQETPLFVAALNGKKDAFLCLHSLSPRHKGFPRIRGKDGETVLHSAINGDYFDLAFQIIKLNPELAEWKTEHGLSPLHILASKPTAFKSGSHLGWFSQIIYLCTFVDKVKVETSVDPSRWKTEEENDSSYPENYQVCADVFRFFVGKKDKENEVSIQVEASRDPENPAERGHEMFPADYPTCFKTIKSVFKAMLIILGFGSTQIRKVRDKKEKHKWSVQVMNQLLYLSNFYQYEDDGQTPQLGARTGFLDLKPEELDPERKDDELGKQTSISTTSVDGTVNEVMQKMVQLFPAEPRSTISDGKINIAIFFGEKKAASDSGKETPTRETPILIAAKNGITEIVKGIMDLFPLAIYDTNSDEKNIVLLAVENRQARLYLLLIEEMRMKEVIFQKVDRDGNSALHLAARLGDYRPRHFTGDGLHMQWELKWYEFVKASVPLNYFAPYNKKGQTPVEIFKESHRALVESGGQWLTNTSQSCSVVAGLIASVVYGTSNTVPGGVKEGSGTPTLENKPLFDVFAISSLIALCFSMTSLVIFLAILTSRRREKDFGRNLPRMLLVGLTLLFISIASMLISFCAGHFFALKDSLKNAALPVYIVTCLFLAWTQFPFYFHLVGATFATVPQPCDRSNTP